MTSITFTTLPSVQFDVSAMVAEINRVRANPYVYAKAIPGMTASDLASIQTIPASAGLILDSKGLGRGAQQWVNYSRDHDITGHGSNPGARLDALGAYQAIGENLSYGYRTPKDIVQAWILDAGIPDKGHRKNLLNPVYTHVGIGYGSHPSYNIMVDALFAKGFVPSF